MMAEETGGEVGWSLYRSYAEYNGGWLWTCAIMFSMFGWLVFNTCFNIWLSVWTGDTLGNMIMVTMLDTMLCLVSFMVSLPSSEP